MNLRPQCKLLVPMLLVAVCAMACTTGSPRATAVSPKSFQETLKVCRFQQGGGLIMRRRTLPPTQPRIAGCLARHGWTPDGMPTEPVRK